MHENTIFFFNGFLSQWIESPFVDEKGIEFNCAEQYMMYQKARLFKDQDCATLIMQTSNPAQQKALGRKVRNFKENIWGYKSFPIVMWGGYLKFTQNPLLKEQLLATDNKELIEANPYDKLWGIGLSETVARRRDPNIERWPGLNLLGKCLMCDRTMIREDETPIKDVVLKPLNNLDKNCIMPITGFVECCCCGGFIDYDGNGVYAMEDGKSTFKASPFDICKGRVLRDFTHVVWYNK